MPPLDTAIRALHKLVGNANPDGAQLMTCTGARGCALAVLYAMNKVYGTAAGAPLQVGTCSSLEFTLTAATLQPRLLFFVTIACMHTLLLMLLVLLVLLLLPMLLLLLLLLLLLMYQGSQSARMNFIESMPQIVH